MKKQLTTTLFKIAKCYKSTNFIITRKLHLEQPTVSKVILTTFGQQVDFLALRRVRQILVQAGTSFTFESAVFGFISRKNFLYL